MATKKSKASGKSTATPFVVVRTYSAGVHVGELVARRGMEVDLANARRIWNWQGANTLHEVALRGVGKGSKVSETIGSITLTQAIEILTATEVARANLQGAAWG